MCTYSRWPHWHPVGVVIDPVDTCWNCRWLRVTTMSTPTLLENFEGFSVILKEQSGEKGTCSSLKIWKPPSLKKNLLVCLVHDFARMQLQTWDFPTLRSTFITKMKKFAKPFVPVHMGPRLNLISKNITGRKAFYCTTAPTMREAITREAISSTMSRSMLTLTQIICTVETIN